MVLQGQEGRLRLAYDVKKPQILTTVLELLQKELAAVALAARDYDYSSSAVSPQVMRLQIGPFANRTAPAAQASNALLQPSQQPCLAR